jgi:two-component system chemotaxis response regulator CheY
MSLLALVVDDSMLIRHTVCRFLEDRGFRVESATNGLEALEMLMGIRPDIIVTDLQMPKMDGGQLIDALNANPETAAIPVIILAGRQSPEQPAGISARYVIYKDIDIVAQLGRAVETVLPGSLSSLESSD